MDQKKQGQQSEKLKDQQDRDQDDEVIDRDLDRDMDEEDELDELSDPGTSRDQSER